MLAEVCLMHSCRAPLNAFAVATSGRLPDAVASRSEQRAPDAWLILPGVVSHATNVVEHPELVAERIGRFAGLVGRVRPQIAWAKLETLAQGAAIASRQLW
jgi:hypothetical protein